MADEHVEKIAGELAELALADERRTEDEKIVNEISEIVGASSQTLQESYLTAVRVRRAERRARQLLADRAAEQILSSTRMITDERPDDQKNPKTTADDDAGDTDDLVSDEDASDVEAEIDNLINPMRSKDS